MFPYAKSRMATYASLTRAQKNVSDLTSYVGQYGDMNTDVWCLSISSALSMYSTKVLLQTNKKSEHSPKIASLP